MKNHFIQAVCESNHKLPITAVMRFISFSILLKAMSAFDATITLMRLGLKHFYVRPYFSHSIGKKLKFSD